VLSGVAALAAGVTFHKDVEPILQKNCQTCHRLGEAAPMSFLTYESTRPWAKAIKNAVVTRKMPPWYADRQYGHFKNDPTLAPSDIEILSQWADGGAPQGDPKDAPAAIKWPQGWKIQPDVVANVPPYSVPAKGMWNGSTSPFLDPSKTTPG
jgi:hypothetical protein